MDKNYLAELLKLNEEINQAIYAEIVSEASASEYLEKAKSGASELNKKAYEARINLQNKGKEYYNTTVAPEVKRRMENTKAHLQSMVKNPGEYAKNIGTHIKNNPGATAATAGGVVAGIAGLGGAIYAAKKAAERKRWQRDGCGSLTGDAKTKCQAYLASKK